MLLGNTSARLSHRMASERRDRQDRATTTSASAIRPRVGRLRANLVTNESSMPGRGARGDEYIRSAMSTAHSARIRRQPTRVAAIDSTPARHRAGSFRSPCTVPADGSPRHHAADHRRRDRPVHDPTDSVGDGWASGWVSAAKRGRAVSARSRHRHHAATCSPAWRRRPAPYGLGGSPREHRTAITTAFVATRRGRGHLDGLAHRRWPGLATPRAHHSCSN